MTALLTADMKAGRVAWVQVAQGTATLNGDQLYPGDGVAVSEAGELTLTGTTDNAEILLFDMTP